MGYGEPKKKCSRGEEDDEDEEEDEEEDDEDDEEEEVEASAASEAGRLLLSGAAQLLSPSLRESARYTLAARSRASFSESIPWSQRKLSTRFLQAKRSAPKISKLHDS